MLKHSKKRNVGLLNEFFARHMAKAILENRDDDLKKIKSLYVKHFQKGSELFKELRLFTCLFETSLDSKEAAYSLISQVKDACKLQSQARIDLEKTALLHEINQSKEGQGFFAEEVSAYRDYASIQVLLNHWRGKILTENLSEAIQLEDALIMNLCSKNKKPVGNTLGMSNEDVDGLVVNIMTKKVNDKFSSVLNEEQKKIINLYVFSTENSDAKTRLIECLESIQQRTLLKTNQYIRANGSDVVNSKLVEINKLLSEDYKNVSNPSDDTITFYMTVSQLEGEF